MDSSSSSIERFRLSDTSRASLGRGRRVRDRRPSCQDAHPPGKPKRRHSGKREQSIYAVISWTRENVCNADDATFLLSYKPPHNNEKWEEFTAAELCNFLKVLDREEANHEMQIRERYLQLRRRLRETMQTMQPHPTSGSAQSK